MKRVAATRNLYANWTFMGQSARIGERFLSTADFLNRLFNKLAHTHYHACSPIVFFSLISQTRFVSGYVGFCYLGVVSVRTCTNTFVILDGVPKNVPWPKSFFWACKVHPPRLRCVTLQIINIIGASWRPK